MKVHTLQKALTDIPPILLKNQTIQLLKAFAALFNKPSEQNNDITFYDFICYMRAKGYPADSYFVNAFFSDLRNSEAIKILKQFEDFDTKTKLLDGDLKGLTSTGSLAKEEFSNNFYRIGQCNQYYFLEMFGILKFIQFEFPQSNLQEHFVVICRRPNKAVEILAGLRLVMPPRHIFGDRPRIFQANHLLRICQFPEHAQALGQIIHIISQTTNDNSNPGYILSELVDQIFQHSAYIAKMSDIINKTRTTPAHLTYVLQILAKHKLFFRENLELLTQGTNIKNFIEVIEFLEKHQIHITAERCQAVLNNLSNSYFVVTSLKRKDVPLTDADRLDIAKSHVDTICQPPLWIANLFHDVSSNASFSLDVTKPIYFFNKDFINLAFKNPQHAGRILTVFELLRSEKKYFTLENFHEICNVISNIEHVLHKLNRICCHGKWNRENFNLICEYHEDSRYNSNFMLFTTLCNTLHSMDKLTQHNFDNLCLGLWHIYALEHLIHFLKQKETDTNIPLLTPRTFDLIFQKIQHDEDLLFLLELLDRCQLFNLENMHVVLEHVAILKKFIRTHQQHITRDVFAEIIRRCQLARGNELAARGAITVYLTELGIAAPVIQQPRPIQQEERDPDAQSTHVELVHKSASQSAQLLFQHYGELLKNLSTYSHVMGEFYNRLQNFPYEKLGVEKVRLEAAQRALSRIISNCAEYGDYTDPVSKVTLRLLLALLWMAGHDKAKIEDPDECEKLFIEGLYECQLGKNANKKTVDGKPLPDSPICASGSLNKLLEKFSKVHPLVNVTAISLATASKKMVRVAKQQAANYLNSLSQSQFDSVANKALIGDTSDIWNNIKEKVKAEMLSEFEPYLNKIRLMEIIEQCEYMTFNEEVEVIRKQRTVTPNLGTYIASNYPQGYLASITAAAASSDPAETTIKQLTAFRPSPN